jgi:hypothetical protein
MAKAHKKRKTMIYKGFQYLGKVYVWHKKELYRLPYNVDFRYYGLLKCKPWQDGYNLGNKRKSMKQLQSMTVTIKSDFRFQVHEDVPF